MNSEYKIITDINTFQRHVANWKGPIVADVETKDPTLLGLALCDLQGQKPIYIPTNQWNKTKQIWEQPIAKELHSALKTWLSEQQFIGHNFVYDRRRIDLHWGVRSFWIADTRLMWHLSSAPSGPRPYGLKDAQKDLLGWTETNEKELDANVKLYGGSIRKGDHYLADLHLLAKYACLDVLATAKIYNHLLPFFIQHEYHWMVEKMMQYNILLDANTRQGVMVDRKGLDHAHARLVKRKEAAKKRFLKQLGSTVDSLERDWADRKIAGYKRQYNKDFHNSHPERWQRFNLNSDKDKRELFYDKLQSAVLYTTESGKPATSADAIKQMKGEWVEGYIKYEKANTLSTNFTKPYLDASLASGRLHPGFNICGTVSYRLSGFKPYLLNAPFDEKSIMRNMRVDDGCIGVHADLSAIEPTITAHYSEDPSLLKVFRDGLGDIYLDLALELFPNDKELHEGYNPRVPITKAVKEKFKASRNIAKVIQLAVQYTGTGHTVAKNLTKSGIETTVEVADGYVRAYWRKFRKVSEMNYRLRELNRSQGHLRNVIGRIVRVPEPEYKDLSNRFIQSSAHDVLVLWVLEIYRLCEARKILIKPVLLDCHDSTSNSCPIEQEEALRGAYRDALLSVNAKLGLCVDIKAETKSFHTLAGLKGEE